MEKIFPFKLCSVCKKMVPRKDFYPEARNSKDGLYYCCKACKRDKSKLWRYNHPEKVKEYNDNRKADSV